MKPGTTPTHTFKLSVSPVLIKDIRVIYAVGGKAVLVKELKDGQLTSDSFVVRLTERDTYRLTPGTIVEIQLRALTATGDVLNSNIMQTTVERCLDTEVMT